MMADGAVPQAVNSLVGWALAGGRDVVADVAEASQ
jgi:hypothetical protein